MGNILAKRKFHCPFYTWVLGLEFLDDKMTAENLNDNIIYGCSACVCVSLKWEMYKALIGVC